MAIRPKFIVCVMLVCSVVFFASSASANSRFPEANGIFFSSTEPDLVVVRVSFGLLLSRDRGRTFDWVCERSIGMVGVEDPMYALTPNGTLLGATFQGLTVSKDGACSFTFAGGALDKGVFIDLTQRPNDRRSVVAFASTFDKKNDAGQNLFESYLFETTDEGASFAPLGSRIDPTLLGETVDVTATNPDRLYVSGVRDPGVAPKAIILSSNDRGQNYTPSELVLEGTEKAAYIAGVDPFNADRIYFRTDNGLDKPGRIVMSDDGAKTFRTIFTSQGALRGFALSADGSKVFVGGPKDGLHMASTSDFEFTQRSTVEIQCLATGTDGLWACSNEKVGFIAGRSTDEGATFETMVRFCTIRGGLAGCPGTTVTGQCASEWTIQSENLGCGSFDAGPDAGAPTPPAPDSDSCALHAPSNASFGALGIAGLAASVVLARRRLRKNDERAH